MGKFYLIVLLFIIADAASIVSADVRCQYNRCNSHPSTQAASSQPGTLPLLSAIDRPSFGFDIENELSLRLERPLIIGASVSNDFLAPSPGRIAYEWFSKIDDSKTEFKKIAFSQGQSGPEILKHLSEKDFNNRSIAIAIDLFFHDPEYVSADCPDSVTAVGKFIEGVAELKVPLVIGNVPKYPFPRFHLLKTWPFVSEIHDSEICREAINQAIAEHCEDSESCQLLDLQQILNKVMTAPIGSAIDGQSHRLIDIFPDLTHPSEFASSFVAEELLFTMLKNKTLVAE